MTPLYFTKNKQVVRDLQCKTIENTFSTKLGNLRYFGLTSPEMEDVRNWSPIFSKIIAVERGRIGEEYLDQHNLQLTAAKYGLLSKLVLLRGDIDAIALSGKDTFNNSIPYPVDVVSLDYSGGLFYKNGNNKPYRLKAIENIIHQQSLHNVSWLLFISCNLDNLDLREVKETFNHISTEFTRTGFNIRDVFESYLTSSLIFPILKIYVPYYINQITSKYRFSCASEKVITYPGNNRIEMLNFRFLLRKDESTFAPRFPIERLRQIINCPMIRIENGIQKETNFNLLKIK